MGPSSLSECTSRRTRTARPNISNTNNNNVPIKPTRTAIHTNPMPTPSHQASPPSCTVVPKKSKIHVHQEQELSDAEQEPHHTEDEDEHEDEHDANDEDGQDEDELHHPFEDADEDADEEPVPPLPDEPDPETATAHVTPPLIDHHSDTSSLPDEFDTHEPNADPHRSQTSHQSPPDVPNKPTVPSDNKPEPPDLPWLTNAPPDQSDNSSLSSLSSVLLDRDPPEDLPEGVNTTIFQQHLKHQKDHGVDPSCTLTDRCDVALLHILQKARAPLCLFDHVMDWAERAKNDKFRFDSKRKTSLAKLCDRFDLQGLRPTKHKLKLTNGNTVEIVKHDLKQCFRTLLSDATICCNENHLFGETPSSPPDPKPTMVRDINTGKFFINAHKKFCNSDRDVLCPILIGMDKTHTDLHGNLSVEMVMFTLGILDLKTRRRPEAWMCAGCIINQSLDKNKPLGGDHQARDKLIDCHAMIELMLEDLCDLQKNGGFLWPITCKQVTRDCILHVPNLVCIGDTLGHNQICCHFTGSSNICGHCRACNCPRRETGNPFHPFKHTKQSTIDRLVENKDTESLRQISCHCVRSAMSGFVHCDPIRGLHAALPGEILHMMQHGLFPESVITFFQLRRFSKAAKKQAAKAPPNKQPTKAQRGKQPKNKKQQHTKHPKTGMRVSDPSKLHELEAHCCVFQDTNRGKADFELAAAHVGKLLSQQSDRDLPRTYFPQGIIPVKKKGKSKPSLHKNAHEMEGVLLVIVLVLCSNCGWDVVATAMEIDRHHDWIGLLELMIMFEEFLKTTSGCRRSHLHAAKSMIQAMMNCFVDCVCKTNNRVCRSTKVHLTLHVIDDILNLGCHEVFSTGPTESHHITNAKATARNTQRHVRNFEFQVGERLVESIAMRRSQRELDRPNRNTMEDLDARHVRVDAKHLLARESGVYEFTAKKKVLRAPSWIKTEFGKAFSGTLKTILAQVCVQQKQLVCCSRCKIDDLLTRSNLKSGRLDWVLVDWMGDGLHAVQVFTFVHLVVNRPCRINGMDVESTGHCGIGHCLENPVSQMESSMAESRLVLHSTKWHHRDENKDLGDFVVFPLHSIAGPCCVVPNFRITNGRVVQDDPCKQGIFLLIRPRKEWSGVFLDMAKKFRSGDDEVMLEVELSDEEEEEEDAEEEGEEADAEDGEDADGEEDDEDGEDDQEGEDNDAQPEEEHADQSSDDLRHDEISIKSSTESGLSSHGSSEE